MFTLCAVFVFKTDRLGWNHVAGFALLVAAVCVIFRKWGVPSMPLLLLAHPLTKGSDT